MADGFLFGVSSFRHVLWPLKAELEQRSGRGRDSLKVYTERHAEFPKRSININWAVYHPSLTSDLARGKTHAYTYVYSINRPHSVRKTLPIMYKTRMQAYVSTL